MSSVAESSFGVNDPAMAYHLAPLLLLFCATQSLLAQGMKDDFPVYVLPSNYSVGQWVPAAVVWWAGDDPARVQLSKALADSGFAVAVLDAAPEPKQLGVMLMGLRQRVRVAQGGLHAVILNRQPQALAGLLAHGHEFQTVTVCGPAASVDLAAVKRLRTRRVRSMATSDAGEIRDHLLACYEDRRVGGVAGEVSRTLDSFHDAAAVADEDRYFAILPKEAVFLGTDATERWTGDEFRTFAMRYFRRKSAWTYVPLQRSVTLSEGGKTAWFDEVLDNASYGECRGSGVLVRRGAGWVLLQYNLTVPVPNDLMAGVAQQIRQHLDDARASK